MTPPGRRASSWAGRGALPTSSSLPSGRTWKKGCPWQRWLGSMACPGPRSAVPLAGRREVAQGDAIFKNTWTLPELDLARMGLIADEQPAMALTLKTAGKARTWVPPGRPRKDRGLKSHPARSFFAPTGAKNGEINGLEASGQFSPGRDPEGRRGALSPGNGGAGTSGTDDSWFLRLRYGRGYRGTLTLPRGPGPWPTPPAGPASTAPMPSLTAARAPRGSWPAPSTPTSAAVARDFLQYQGHFGGDQDPRPTTHLANSVPSGSFRF